MDTDLLGLGDTWGGWGGASDEQVQAPSRLVGQEGGLLSRMFPTWR